VDGLKVTSLKIPEVKLIEPKVFGDDRGFFMESFHTERYREAGINEAFVQDNVSYSSQGVLRGLHYQYPQGQGKLIYVLQGSVYDVAVDVRHGSPTFGQWVAAVLTNQNHYQLYVPPGFAHGFCVLSEKALFSYKCTEFYHPETECSILWDDPSINIEWPIRSPKLSPKDDKALRLADVAKEKLPPYRPA